MRVMAKMGSNSVSGGGEVLDWTDLLLAHPADVPQYIIEIAEGEWECRCGNSSSSEGFRPARADGSLTLEVLGPWDGKTYACDRCGRVVDGDTLQILGHTSDGAWDANFEPSWNSIGSVVRSKREVEICRNYGVTLAVSRVEVLCDRCGSPICELVEDGESCSGCGQQFLNFGLLEELLGDFSEFE